MVNMKKVKKVPVRKWILVAFATGIVCASFAQPPITPKAGSYISCPDATVILEVEPQIGVSFNWYSAASGGATLALASNSCSVTPPSLPYTVWVASSATPNVRTPITIQLSQSCGKGMQVNCAVNGTLLFKEDFGGNDPLLDDPIKTSGIPQVDTIYKYTTVSALPAGIEAEARYSINKQSLSHSIGAWYIMDDHTHPGELTKGYMLQVNASHEKGQFYEVTINGLCPGTKLYFSAWLVSIVNINIAHKTNQVFILEDYAGNIIAQYNTGDIDDKHPYWEQYGFEFIVPAGITSLTLRIINNGAGSSGNDFCLDDIEIHFCSPPVTLTTPPVLDACPCLPATLSGTYTDDGTFGNSLMYRWEYSLTGDPTSAWTPVTDNLAATSPLDTSYTIPVVCAADTGYYRLVVGNSSTIGSTNCCATSDPVRLWINPSIRANTDNGATLPGVPTSIDVLSNDNFDVCLPESFGVSVTTAPASGATAAFDVNKKLIYTPPTNFSGLDSLEYSLISTCCDDTVSTAKVYVYVLKPKARNYIACPRADVTLEIEPLNGVSYYWFADSTGGLSLANNVNSYKVINVAPPDTVWVEPRTGVTIYPRVPLIIQISQSCGKGVQVDCAINGTLLFREDFGGNDPDDDPVKTSGIPQVDNNIYSYKTGSPACYGCYSIRKYSGANSSYWYQLDDHTHPGDPTKGYLLQVDAAGVPGQFYETELLGLCPGMKLYFSAWIVSVDVDSCPNPANQTFRLEDISGNIIAQYYTGNIEDAHPVWEQYGFEFTVPPGVSSLTLRIINNGAGSNGNDFCMDDIEIHFCSPPVTITKPLALDTTLCTGASFTLSGTYTDDGTFGNDLTYRWEHSLTGDPADHLTWTPVTLDLTGTSPLDVSHNIPSVSVTDTGYYRLLVSNSTSSIGMPNCRATSEPVRLRIGNDIFADSSITSYTASGASVDITVGIINTGGADIVSPLWVALYMDSTSPNDTIFTVAIDDVALFPIHPGDTAYITVNIPDISIYPPFIDLIIRVNDDGVHFPATTECDSTDNKITLFNPYMSAYMTKEATLWVTPSLPFAHNGAYANPVAVLYGDTIEYKISAVNANLSKTGTTMTIRDTVPLYLDYAFNSATNGGLYNPLDRDITWSFSGLGLMEQKTVSFKATPASGVAASQPLFINRAWITTSDTLFSTNNTYHQGAGVSILTFSAGYGGSIYNAAQQALDYRTSPNPGVFIVPDEGYIFAGWSHGDYRSLRNELISAKSGIMHYDTLTIYGDVTLRADFELEMYPITYYLNGSENADANPRSYTIKSPEFILLAPEKWRDVFIGWTGSNGDEPQLEVIIPAGSTGERTYYANFLRSGREKSPITTLSDETGDKIWVEKNKLNIYTSKAGSIVRVFTLNGILYKLQPIVTAGTTTIKLPKGLYIVVLNNNAGKKIAIIEN